MPLYIGDWEQDTNSISLQSEGAWLKIILKMFKDDKKGVYKASTKSLQNLWRSTESEVKSIVAELVAANIGEIKELDGEYVFKNRRMIREKNLSIIRSKAVQNRYNHDTNNLHPLENENDIENENSNDSLVTQTLKVGSNFIEQGGFSEKTNYVWRTEILRQKPFSEFDGNDFVESWVRFLDYMAEDKARYMDWRSQEVKLQSLYDLTHQKTEAIRIIETTISSGWKTFIKPSKNGAHFPKANEKKGTYFDNPTKTIK